VDSFDAYARSCSIPGIVGTGADDADATYEWTLIQPVDGTDELFSNALRNLVPGTDLQQSVLLFVEVHEAAPTNSCDLPMSAAISENVLTGFNCSTIVRTTAYL
jgi:hypothetical protein